MQLIDTHTHLFLDNFKDDIEEVIDRAKKNNVAKMFCPNVDLSTVNKLHSLTKKFSDTCYPLMGLHPESIKENFEEDLAEIEKLLKKNKYYGIGEIGIDLYWDKTYKAQQIEAFHYQVQLAKKHKLPVIIHTREAFNEVFTVIDKEIDENLKGIFHCFTGDEKQAEHILEYKTFMFGIGGIITYKKTHLPEVVKNIPLNYIVLETDSPFLSPVPKRGKRNESSYIIYIAEFLSKLKNTDIEDIANITTKNAKHIFNL